MGYIADLSRYDPLTAVDQYDGVILNIEDPGFAAKRDRAIAKSIPWGTYSWVYPGQGAAAAQRAHDAGTGPLGAWLDYEEQGVSPADITQALTRGDQLGVKLGVYTYLYILDSNVKAAIGNHPLWLAYYPGQNDGSYRPNYSDDARSHGALLHQFTSSNGTRDLSVVVDEPAWSAWTGPTPASEPTATEDEDMDKLIFNDGKVFHHMNGEGLLMPLGDAVAVAAGPYGTKECTVTDIAPLAVIGHNAAVIEARKKLGV